MEEQVSAALVDVQERSLEGGTSSADVDGQPQRRVSAAVASGTLRA